MSAVVAYCWEVNAQHPCVRGESKLNSGGTTSELGQRGPWFPIYTVPLHSLDGSVRCISTNLPRYNPWGLTQIWRLANGQEVRVKWKQT
jgi:hypothetical protein